MERKQRPDAELWLTYEEKNVFAVGPKTNAVTKVEDGRWSSAMAKRKIKHISSSSSSSCSDGSNANHCVMAS